MAPVQIDTDIEFAVVDGVSLKLDLYRPQTDAIIPAVVYLHGGGWQVGDKSDGAKERLAPLAALGIAVVSANYRLVSHAIHPAQVHDAKAAVRWVRRCGATYRLATRRIGIWGASAGAYLASMVALTPEWPERRGAGESENETTSSHVHAAVHWFGQTDLFANSGRSWLEKRILPPPFESGLLGLARVEDDEAAARAASPLTYVNSGAPPFLIAHGDRDRVTPVSESLALHDALVRAGADSTMLLLGGAGHEGQQFDRADHLRLTAAFLLSHLGPREAT